MTTGYSKLIACLCAVTTLVLAIPSHAAPASPLPCSTTAKATATVFAPPGAAEATNWAPACVRIFSGGSVTFTAADAVFHVPFAKGCFEHFPQLTAGKSATIQLQFDEEYQELVAWFDGIPSACDVGALQQRQGAVPFGSTGPALPVIELDGQLVKVHFICSFHGAAMKGEIVVERQLPVA